MTENEKEAKYIRVEPQIKEPNDLLFRLTLEGGHTSGKQIKTDLYGSVLTSMNNILQVSNEVLNGKNSKIYLYVKETKGGSWETIIVFSQEVLLAIAQSSTQIIGKAFEIYKHYKDYLEMLEHMYFIIHVLLQVGKVKEILLPKNKNEKYTIIGEKGKAELDTASGKLLTSKRYRDNMQEVFYNSFNKSDIDALSLKSKGKTHSVAKGDKEAFNFENIEEIPEEIDFTGIYLEIISLTFSAKSKWRFYAKSHTDFVGKAIIEAKIEDQHFFEKIKAHDYVFEDGDILRCNLKMLKYEDSKMNKFFVTSVHSKVNKENYEQQTLL